MAGLHQQPDGERVTFLPSVDALSPVSMTALHQEPEVKIKTLWSQAAKKGVRMKRCVHQCC